jgi:hypothetical protein
VALLEGRNCLPNGPIATIGGALEPRGVGRIESGPEPRAGGGVWSEARSWWWKRKMRRSLSFFPQHRAQCLLLAAVLLLLLLSSNFRIWIGEYMCDVDAFMKRECAR